MESRVHESKPTEDARKLPATPFSRVKIQNEPHVSVIKGYFQKSRGWVDLNAQVQNSAHDLVLSAKANCRITPIRRQTHKDPPMVGEGGETNR